jgi:hypothetical protein
MKMTSIINLYYIVVNNQGAEKKCKTGIVHRNCTDRMQPN